MSLDLKFDRGLKLVVGSYPNIYEDKNILCVIKEKVDGMTSWGVLESILMKQNTFFSSFRSFLGDLKVEAYTFDFAEGLQKIDEKFIDLRGSKVRIDLFSEDIEEVKIWTEQCLYFSRTHDCDIIVSQDKDLFLSEITNIFKNTSVSFVSFLSDIQFDFRFEIGRFDIQTNGIQLTGCAKIYQDLSCGWILQSGWRYFRTFKNPRDWNYLSSEQIASDILNLPENNNPRKGYADYNYWKNRIHRTEQNLIFP